MLQRFSHFLRRYRKRRLHGERFKQVYRCHPDYRTPVQQEIERAHTNLWRAHRKDIHLDTLRVCANISGQPFFGSFTEEVINYCAEHPEDQ